MSEISLDNHYTDPQLAALYDLTSGWSEDRRFYLDLVKKAKGPQMVLDVGCGTGFLTAAFAKEGHFVSGADPAKAMLTVARGRDGGKNINWQLADAKGFTFEDRFDLIIMTGHAFQVLLTLDDIIAALQNIRKHLKDGGQFVFESRNPDFDWREEWDYEYTLQISGVNIMSEARRMDSWDGRYADFTLSYDLRTGDKTSKSRLFFPTRDEIRQCLSLSDLKIDAFYGDWDKGAFNKDTSEEMIFVTSPA